MKNNTVYFDNAATTFPKPQSVTAAALDCMESWCGNAGRGSHPLALRSAEAVFEAREGLAEMFGTEPERVIFTLNTTYALNIAIKGIMSRGGHALISNMEHNSVLRPLARLASDRIAKYDVFTAYDSSRRLSAADIISNIISKLRPDTKLLVCTHASNVCSYSLPIGEIGKFCRRHGIIFVVDAAQSAGHLPINMRDDCIDVLCMPAHKGLYSPQGLGMMLLGENVAPDTLVEGGNGVNSLDVGMGTEAPERYEAGTLCTPAIAGLCEGLRFIRGVGLDSIRDREESLWRRAARQLSLIDGVTVYAPQYAGPVLLWNIDGLSPDDVGRSLSERGFCLRTGYHCAPLAHRALGTSAGGAVRMSFSIFNREDEVDGLCSAVREIAAAKA